MKDDKKLTMKTSDWSRALWERCKKVFNLHDARITALEQGGGGGAVSGVKGDTESTYRTGNVNLTPANLGAQVDMGFYIDAQGYMCQRISTDT